MTTIGLLHPGSMGAPVGACAVQAGHRVLWTPEGRSEATRARAEQYSLEAATLEQLLADADVLLSLCPPAAAVDIAQQVADIGFTGVYIDANAVRPATVLGIADVLPKETVLVDAAVVGSPPVAGKTPTLYLAGPADATDLAEELFAATAVHTTVLGTEPGQASALKLAYSSFQKASRMLAALAVGVAAEHGVDQELAAIAARRTGSYLAETAYIPKTAARAWRWGPELEEAAEMLADAGLPPDMLTAAAAALARWDDSKDQQLSIDEALARLAHP
ncbi:NAD(P)-dependent oxidoreductase [Streptacidiphilus anmyonensis]|uniref:NAD(P)-dependent oxidoreductase n=1 Tax=Streptacidiphilus anmyonensis TaxID=405782 RepID=UPI0005A86772|nr:NAD(P)-dependent oxidoreductase [Streptacidiphilus anmyonensis]